VGAIFGASEIPLLLTLFYLFCGVETRHALFLALRHVSMVRSRWKTLSGGEFGWGVTSVKR
jgi:hypothetical protein